MKKRNVLSLVTALTTVSLLLAGTFTAAAGADLVSLLTSELGVTKDQAQGGAGAIFDFAKGKLSADDFSKIADAVPNMDSLLKAAPAAGGGLTKKLGSLTGGGSSLGGLASLAGSFSKLGLNADMVSKFVPQILSFVESSGGQGVMKVLQGILQ